MLGMVDLPYEVFNKLKSRVHKGGADRASSAASTTSNTSPDLGNQRPESAVSGNTNLTDATTINAAWSVRSGDDRQHEEHEAVPHVFNPEHHEHTINICSFAKATHEHLMNPKDRASSKAVEKVKRGGSIAAITVLRPPMDFILAIARGFHNMPKMYGDDTVRPQEKIIDFKSGVATAGREFGLGWYDGITGVVTQPYHGAEKHGAKGFLVGTGKGVGGLFLKPTAGKQFPFLFPVEVDVNSELGVFGLPGYTLRGVYREIQEHRGITTYSYVIAARITQGHQEWETSTPEERLKIIENYRAVKDHPKLKRRSYLRRKKH
jgi:hypothetical protein